MNRVRSLGDQRKAGDYLDALEQNIFIEQLGHKKMQIERKAASEVRRKSRGAGKVCAVEDAESRNRMRRRP